MELNLERPLLFFDIESTGLNIVSDAIIELSFVKILPGGEQRIKTWKIKPWDYVAKKQLPINPAASAVNGVHDEDLVDCPTFADVVDEVVEWIGDSDLAGFNSAKFDLPLLAEEIERVREYTGKQVDINLHDKKMVDVQNIYHILEPRNLKAAYRFYCGGEDFDNAHTAEADTVATYKVLQGQLDMYPDKLKNNVDFLSAFSGRTRVVDYAGRLISNDKGEAVISFGKHKGKTAREVYLTEPSYFAWIMQGEFALDTKRQFALLKEEFDREKLVQKFNGTLF
ncbi:MAG: 3'-5' exonuclease [Bacteroidales bacterium]|nr:3'-5' exonuclease [Bacteroidales bacterium]